MNNREPTIRVNVDVTNPGQFFACCGLLELADRLWGGAEGWFDTGHFRIAPLVPGQSQTLNTLLAKVSSAQVVQIDPEDDCSSPMCLPEPFALTINWWLDDQAGGTRLKVWAGSMRSVRIAKAMQATLSRFDIQADSIFDQAMVVFDPSEPEKKVEPYYFDGRRGSNAQSRDIAFAPDALQMTTAAYPAVEFLSIVGLQRFRPRQTDQPRVFDYFTWMVPCLPELAAAMACGLCRGPESRGFRFENAFRTDQKKHKSFLPATPIGDSR